MTSSGMVRRLKSVHLDGLSNEKIDAVLDGMNRIEPGIAFYVDASGQVSSADLVGVSIENPGESFKIARHKGVYRRDVSTDGLMSILATKMQARDSWAPICFRRTGSRS